MLSRSENQGQLNNYRYDTRSKVKDEAEHTVDQRSGLIHIGNAFRPVGSQDIDFLCPAERKKDRG